MALKLLPNHAPSDKLSLDLDLLSGFIRRLKHCQEAQSVPQTPTDQLPQLGSNPAERQDPGPSSTPTTRIASARALEILIPCLNYIKVIARKHAHAPVGMYEALVDELGATVSKYLGPWKVDNDPSRLEDSGVFGVLIDKRADPSCHPPPTWLDIMISLNLVSYVCAKLAALEAMGGLQEAVEQAVTQHFHSVSLGRYSLRVSSGKSALLHTKIAALRDGNCSLEDLRQATLPPQTGHDALDA